MIQTHQIYQALGQDEKYRAKVYQELFRAELDEDSMKKINDAWLTGTPLGNDFFKEMHESKLMRKVGQDRRGRPNKVEPLAGKGL